jgi:ribulose-5-phosphate 4-epimerase/fuculose-1-phosphate aldolase
MEATLSRLITAIHILHQQNILDEHGHVSVRNPHDPSTFFTSNVPAILVSSKNDPHQWHVRDCSPVAIPYNGCQAVQTVPEFSEHYIDGCIYDRYPGVQSVVHSHNQSSIVYGLCNSPGSMLQPSYLMAGFLRSPNPIFDAAHHYDGLPLGSAHNLLITHKYLGDAVAEALSNTSGIDGTGDLPDHNVVFLRGHGFVTWASNIEDVVYKSIHVSRCADSQTAAMAQRGDSGIEIVYLSEREAIDCETTINRTFPTTWLAWVAQAERSGQYYNALKIKTGV